MAMSDQQARLGVIAGGTVMVLVIMYLRFCGNLSLPPKPPPPSGPSGTQSQLLSQSTASPAVYKTFLREDAANAGIAAPSIEDMSRKFAYRVDDARHVLEPGKAPVELAGLRLHLERTNDEVVLVIESLLSSDAAYEISTEPSIGGDFCSSVPALPYDAMVIGKGATTRRTECGWRNGLAIVVTRVETLEVPPLGALYLRRVPPLLVGIPDRLARGNQGPSGRDRCSSVVPAVVRGALERGDIGWRDLVDFYARHRCQSYHFPVSYRALKEDGAISLPAVPDAR